VKKFLIKLAIKIAIAIFVRANWRGKLKLIKLAGRVLSRKF
jgi:hypothetical protein